MSISVEQAEQHKNELAVLCCRTEEGTVIGPDNLEDPMIIPELADSGLVDLADDTAKIGEVIGATLLKTVDSLTPLTPDLLEGMKEMEEEVEEVEEDEETEEAVEEVEAGETVIQAAPGGPIRIKIAEGKGIDIELKL